MVEAAATTPKVRPMTARAMPTNEQRPEFDEEEEDDHDDEEDGDDDGAPQIRPREARSSRLMITGLAVGD